MTLDWWDVDKPGWNRSGLLNLDLQNLEELKTLFRKASPGYVRIEGSLADTIVYLHELQGLEAKCVNGISCLNESMLLDILESVCRVGNSMLFCFQLMNCLEELDKKMQMQMELMEIGTRAMHNSFSSIFARLNSLNAFMDFNWAMS